MDEDLIARIENQVDSCPQAIRSYLRSDKLTQHVDELMVTHGISKDLKTELAFLCTAVLIGSLDAGKLPEWIIEEMKLSPEAAQALADSIADKILNPLYDALVSDLEKQDQGAAASVTTEAQLKKDIVIDTKSREPYTPESISYTNQKKSTQRTGREGIVGDPYREQTL